MGTVNASNYAKSKKVLVFSPEKVLIAVYRSIQTAALTMNLKGQSISYAANGKLVSTGNYYFRTIPDNIEVEVKDLGELKLIDWDNLCGVERKVFRNRVMRPTGKYKKKEANGYTSSNYTEDTL